MRLWPLLACVALSGCTLKFSEFEEFPPNTTPDLGIDVDVVVDIDVAGPNNLVDMDEGSSDQDIRDDMTVTGGVIGTACVDDTVCDGGICALGFCTLDCVDVLGCPSGSYCAFIGGMGLCVLECSADDECAAESTCAELAEIAGGARTACLPDADLDRAADLFDNCVSDANAGQADLDRDGVGDVCDPEPACGDGHVDGVVTRGPLAYGASEPSLPSYADHWLLAAGGVDSTDTLVDLLASFDGRSGATLASLPYAARSFAAVQITPNEYVLTPGDLGTEAQFGRLLHVRRDGSVRQGVPFQPEVHAPVLAAGPAGALWLLGYVQPAVSGSTRYEVRRFDPASERFVQVNSINDGVRMRWSVTRDLEGRIFFYSTVFDSFGQRGRWLSALPGANSATQDIISYPNVGTDFDPLFVPAPGGFYVWDRNTGRGFSYYRGVFTEVPELTITHGLSSPSWVSQRSGPGLHLVGSPAGDPGMLSSVSISLACLPATALWDSDGDGVSNPLDLCPEDGAAGSADTDGDWIGDGCDGDADGDGISDVIDPSPLDTDNDGLLNDLDDDDDGDGIADAVDRRPFDTDNDGLRNALDTDDDDDGFSDSDEANARTNPLDPLHFPASGTLVWATSNGAKFAPLQDLENPQDLPRAGIGTATNLRFAAGGQAVLLMDGAAGVTTRVEYIPLGGAPFALEIGATIHGVDVVSSTVSSLDEIVVAHDRLQDPSQVDLSALSFADIMLRPLVTVLTEIVSPDVSGADLVFTAQPQGCSDCRSAYLVSATGSIPRIVAPMVSNPLTIRYNGGAITLLGDASDGTGTAAWFGDVANPVELRPPGATNVTAAVGFADGKAVVAATSANGDALWLWNGAKTRWLRLVIMAEPVTELDWSR